MGFSDVKIITCFLLLNFFLANAQQSTIKDISLKGKFKCSLQPSNQLWLELRVYDENAFATRLNAIYANNTDITACTVSGAGRLTSPFVLSSKIDMTDDSEILNVCGMTMTTENGHKMYNWRVQAYTYPIEYYPNNKGFILSVQCNTSDLVDGRVDTTIDINVSKLVISPLNPSDVTGVDAIATNANIIFSAHLYPNGRSTPAELQGAKGFYAYDCYSATSSDMQADRERFIGDNGCAVSGATYAPSTTYQQKTNTGDYIMIEAKYTKAVPVNNKTKIYITCSLGRCTALNEACCLDICFANTNNLECNTKSNTGVIYSTSFTVQDQRAHELIPVTATGTAGIAFVTTRSDFRIIAFNVPGGVGGNADLLDAKGFYMYSCRYAFNPQMTDARTFVNSTGLLNDRYVPTAPTTKRDMFHFVTIGHEFADARFVNRATEPCCSYGTNVEFMCKNEVTYGECLVPSSKLSFLTDFATDNTLSSPDRKFVTISGLITVQNIGNLQLWVQCNCGKCTVAGHNYCIQRCGAINNNVNGAVDLGYRGHQFILSILDLQNEPALVINIQGPSGQTLTSNSDPVNVGDSVNFSVEVTPGGTGPASAAFVNAKGIFIHSCYAMRNNNQREMFIDGKGCPVPGSPYRTSKNCVDASAVPGVPPFKVDCGSFIVPAEGNITQECNVTICTTENNIFCDNRCAAGTIQSDSNVVDTGITTTAAFNAQLRDDRRTAVRSEELRNIIIAVSVVAAALTLLAVSVGTCIVVNKQKSLATRKLDGRYYNY